MVRERGEKVERNQKSETEAPRGGGAGGVTSLDEDEVDSGGLKG
jgi:hypothetical protein